MKKYLQKNDRIEVVDALRGFAVLAILLVHNIEHFIYPVYPAESVATVSYVPLVTVRGMVMEGTPLVQQTVGVVFDMWHK